VQRLAGEFLGHPGIHVQVQCVHTGTVLIPKYITIIIINCNLNSIDFAVMSNHTVW